MTEELSGISGGLGCGEILDNGNPCENTKHGHVLHWANGREPVGDSDMLRLFSGEVASPGRDVAVRVVERVKASLVADKDQLRLRMATGGTPGDMANAVQAWRVLTEGIRGLERAVDRLLGHDIEDEDDEQ